MVLDPEESSIWDPYFQAKGKLFAKLIESVLRVKKEQPFQASDGWTDIGNKPLDWTTFSGYGLAS